MSPAIPLSLYDWLGRLERLHPRVIELGLTRVGLVRERLRLQPEFPIITVGGTNGKGSTCAMLEAIYSRAGYRVGLYTSPHLLRYNERIRVAMREVTDEALVQTFERIDAARGDTPLTYFEFGTLAAMQLFCDDQVDVAVLEVGLGGRLDAVNAFDADCSVVVTVAIDHVGYLGSTREAIGFEKAGIFRGGRPAICADEEPPQSLIDHARSIGADLRLAGRDFGFRSDGASWQFWSALGKRAGLPFPALRGACQLTNAAAAIAALEAMGARLPVDMGALRSGLLEVELPGRFQVLPGRPQIVLDVGHNPEAARALSVTLESMPCTGRTLAVFGMLADKDIDGVISEIGNAVDEWFICGLSGPRGARAERIECALSRTAGRARVRTYPRPALAYSAAREVAREDDRILVFGSFYTVSEVLAAVRGQ